MCHFSGRDPNSLLNELQQVVSGFGVFEGTPDVAKHERTVSGQDIVLYTNVTFPTGPADGVLFHLGGSTKSLFIGCALPHRESRHFSR